jgi:four helix bundle protein
LEVEVEENCMGQQQDKGSIEGLIAWQRAMDLVDEVYRVTKRWPREEVYGLTNQVRRAAVSVPSNLAEGLGRKADGQFRHFVSIALGSLMEVKTQLLIAERQGYSRPDDLSGGLTTAEELAKILYGLMKSLSQGRKGN